MSILEEIRQGLDPAYSYVIFEKAVGREAEFQDVIRILERLNRGPCAFEILRDEEAGRQFLVAKLLPCPADRILHDLLVAGLPKDIGLFAYGSQPTPDGG